MQVTTFQIPVEVLKPATRCSHRRLECDPPPRHPVNRVAGSHVYALYYGSALASATWIPDGKICRILATCRVTGYCIPQPACENACSNTGDALGVASHRTLSIRNVCSHSWPNS